MIIVLGAPKSGTSVMAGTLAAGGVTFPYTDVHKARKGTAGYMKWESDITWSYFLNVSKGDPFGHGKNWDTAMFQLVMKAMDLPPGETGWKVPQSLLYWARMREEFPSARYVGIFRHPKLVQAHLVSHGYLEPDPALTMWNTYAQALLDAHEALDFPLFEFSPGYDPQRVQRAMGLNAVGYSDFNSTKALSGGVSDNPLYHKLKARICQTDGASHTSSSAA